MKFAFTLYMVAAALFAQPAIGVDVRAAYYHIFVPDELRFRDGNTNSFLPFLGELGTDESIRYQQVFASSAFAALPRGGAYITTIQVRADCLTTGQRALFHTTSFNIWFSTTPKVPDELSPSFAENIGADVVKVRSRQENFGMKNQGCLHPGGTFPLGPRIDLDVPFAYDPAKGNLLMEFQLTAADVPQEPFFLDAENVVGDPISRLVGRGFEAESANIAYDTVGIPVYISFFGKPILSVEHTPQGITLGWSSDPIGFRLQWTSAVEIETAWTDYPGPIPDNPTLKIVDIPSNQLGKTRYFRLFNPTLPPLGN